ncbi:MAG: coproporphyrinogen III oxidase [Oligoflexia bacterium]|nr:coproporphyrinogen III oxidase [Oligoflexia bacterium]
MKAIDRVREIEESLLALQRNIISQLEREDGRGRFCHDRDMLPASIVQKRPELQGASYLAMGVSLVIHPRNPYVPTTHANIRFFCVDTDSAFANHFPLLTSWKYNWKIEKNSKEELLMQCPQRSPRDWINE